MSEASNFSLRPQALLHACLDQGRLSIEKFSRWLRAICTILLSRNSEGDRTKAISYVEQALTVIEDQDGLDPSQVRGDADHAVLCLRRELKLIDARFIRWMSVNGFLVPHTIRASNA